MEDVLYSFLRPPQLMYTFHTLHKGACIKAELHRSLKFSAVGIPLVVTKSIQGTNNVCIQ